MKAVILCGGRGTRIRDVSEVLPKPMLSIGNKPMLWHIMKIYAHYGVKEFILCLGYKGWVIKEFFLNYCAKVSDITIDMDQEDSVVFHQGCEEKLGWKITLAETGEDSQTGARIYNVRRYLQDDDIFSITYGDGLADIDINSLLKAYKEAGLMGIMTGVHPSGRFGEIEASGGRVTSFAEKPNVSVGLFNGGFMIFHRDVFDKYFRDGEDLVLESGVLTKMARDGQLAIYEHSKFWKCVDTPREYEILNKMWKEGKAPWKVWR